MVGVLAALAEQEQLLPLRAREAVLVAHSLAALDLVVRGAVKVGVKPFQMLPVLPEFAVVAVAALGCTHLVLVKMATAAAVKVKRVLNTQPLLALPKR